MHNEELLQPYSMIILKKAPRIQWNLLDDLLEFTKFQWNLLMISGHLRYFLHTVVDLISDTRLACSVQNL